jgi:hypothetical protein
MGSNGNKIWRANFHRRYKNGRKFLFRRICYTGESIPIDKTKGDEVMGTTINKNGLLKVKATRVGQDIVSSRIITLVEEAKTGKAKLEKING